MSNKLWQATPSIYTLMKDLIQKNHPMLGLVEDKIAILFQEKATTSGGVQVLGKTQKASKTVQALAPQDYVFVIRIASDVWMDMNNTEREALVDHCLCACSVEVKKDGGETYKVRKPDLQLFSDNVERYGLALAQPESDNAEKAAAAVEEMFGKSEDPQPSAKVRKPDGSEQEVEEDLVEDMFGDFIGDSDDS